MSRSPVSSLPGSSGLAVALALVASAASPVWAQPADVRTPPPISGHSPSAPETFDAGDVMARLLFVHENLEQIRVYMGRPAPPPPLFVALDANADEAYFTALNLFRRAMRLAFEQLRIEQKWKFEIPERPTPFDIYDVVDSLATTALQLDAALTMMTLERRADRPVAPDDVSELIVVAVGELNRIIVAAGIEQERRPVGAVGRKFPAHSVRRAGLIRTILEQTLEAARQRR